jgi:tRNA(adenine34) deaminase
MTPVPSARHTQPVTSLMQTPAASTTPPTPMQIALAEAEAAAGRGEVPVGAAIVGADGRIIAQAGNRTRELSDPTAHAEMLVIRDACRQLGSERLAGSSGAFDLYVTLEPCPMCAAAISYARIRRLYYAASDPKSGGVDHGARIFAQPTCHHAPDVYAGIEEIAARTLLLRFFRERR